MGLLQGKEGNLAGKKFRGWGWALGFGLALLLGIPAYPQPAQEPALAAPGGERAQPPDSRWAQIRRRGRLRVGLDPSLGPAYLYTDPERQTYAGFEWEILEAIAQTLKVRLEPVYVAWGQQLTALQADEVDLIWGAREGLGLDPQQFLATRPYYLSPQRLVVRDPGPGEAPIEALSQLFGRKVGIVVNSTGAALLEAYNERRGNPIRLFATSNPERLFAQLQAGQLDAVLVDQPVAALHLRQAGSRLRPVGPPLFPIPLVGVVSSQHPSLKEALDEAIAILTENGTLQRILEKWQLWDPTLMSPASAEG
ncbi:ABC transporter substrate-binding protein [Synechococcus sp. H65.1]|uniref:ABC transporter substrate-binding protein n=1 Tax=unclassified Synechococcus TaxID=2626047 RepID=UPI0039C1CD4A